MLTSTAHFLGANLICLMTARSLSQSFTGCFHPIRKLNWKKSFTLKQEYAVANNPAYDPTDQRYYDHKDLRSEVERIFSLCADCRMSSSTAAAFPPCSTPSTTIAPRASTPKWTAKNSRRRMSAKSSICVFNVSFATSSALTRRAITNGPSTFRA